MHPQMLSNEGPINPNLLKVLRRIPEINLDLRRWVAGLINLPVNSTAMISRRRKILRSEVRTRESLVVVMITLSLQPARTHLRLGVSLGAEVVMMVPGTKDLVIGQSLVQR